MKTIVMMKLGIAFFVLAALLITGCVQSDLTMRRESVDWEQERAMVKRSLERFDEGDFFIYEWRPGITAAVVVDIKDAQRTIRPGKGWKKAKTRDELEDAYKGGVATKERMNMRLYRIEGKDGEVWGFFFAPNNQLPFSVIDNNTIELGQIPEPPAPR